MQRIFNRFFLPVLLWSLIAFTHMATSYFDTLKYRPEHILVAKDYLFYLTVYSSWAVFNIALYSALAKIAHYKNIRYFVYMFLIGLVIWLPVFFILDAYLGVLAFGMEFKTVASIFANLSNQIIFFYAILYTVTFGVSAAIVFYQYSQDVLLASLELEKEHSDAKLRLANMQMAALHSQLSPHFLFNCLSSISGLVRHSDKDKVITAIARLGDLLRFTINASKENLILLTEEIEFTEHYISLQKIRYSNKFDYQLIKKDLDNNLVCPPFILQPLIENIFVHSVAQSIQEVVSIKVTITQNNEFLTFELRNSYPLSESCSDNQTTCRENNLWKHVNGLGTSIANLRDRLDLIYKANYSISHGAQGNEYIAKVSIPVVEFYE